MSNPRRLRRHPCGVFRSCPERAPSSPFLNLKDVYNCCCFFSFFTIRVANLQVFYDYSYLFGFVPHPYFSIIGSLLYAKGEPCFRSGAAARRPGQIHTQTLTFRVRSFRAFHYNPVRKPVIVHTVNIVRNAV